MRVWAGLARPRLWPLLLVLLALAPATALTLQAGREQRRVAALRVEAETTRLARLAAAIQKPLVEHARETLLGVAEWPEVTRPEGPACSRRLAELKERHPRYVNVGVVAPDGRLLCSALGALPGVADRRSVRRALEGREVTPGEYQTERVSGRPAVVFSVPLAREDAVSVVLYAAVDLGRLARAAAEVPLPTGATLTVVDAGGTVLVRHPEPRRWVGATMPYAPLVRLVTTRGEGLARLAGLDGVSRLYAFAPIGDPLRSGLFLAIGMPPETGPGEVGPTPLALLGLAAGAVLALGAGWVVSRRLDTTLSTMAAEQRAKEVLIGEVSELVSRRAREVGLLNQLGGFLQACRTVEEAVAVTARMGEQLLEGLTGALFVLDPSRGQVERVGVWGRFAVEGPPVFGPDHCWALRRRQTYVVADTTSGLCCPHLGDPVPAAYACLPLLAQGEALGVLHVAAPPAGTGVGPTGLDEPSQRLAAAVAEQLALSLANLRLRESLRAQSIRDPLTGLYNRRYMEETLARELSRAEREGQPLALLLVDVDHFKRFNDRFGHDGGDAVLVALGGLLRQSVRAGDVACRHGGEEFVLILPGASVDEARRRAEDLQAALRELQVSHRGATLGPVTCSIGLAGFPAHGTGGDALVRAADGALYRAKHAGRDRVVVAE